MVLRITSTQPIRTRQMRSGLSMHDPKEDYRPVNVIGSVCDQSARTFKMNFRDGVTIELIQSSGQIDMLRPGAPPRHFCFNGRCTSATSPINAELAELFTARYLPGLKRHIKDTVFEELISFDAFRIADRKGPGGGRSRSKIEQPRLRGLAA